ncbi:MAG: methyltransferase domain-containing protein [Planctomycetaceae bacterium]|nr:methyltransferase domain-containing protein [Planctomycetaceae bacterium]
MQTLLWIVLGLVALLVVVTFAWRWASRRWALPCPSILSGAVDGTLADKFAGTRETLERLELRPGLTIVEIGPGPGRLLIPAARLVLPGGKAIGVELQPPMLDKLRRKLAADDPGNLELICADATQPVLPAGAADLVYLCTVLGEIPDRRQALENCFAALRPGGRLVIVEIMGDPHYQTRGKVRALCESVGFVFERLTGNWRRSTSSFRKPG